MSARLLLADIKEEYMSYVRGYVKRDGTYVRPHIRRSPGSGSSALGAVLLAGALLVGR